MVIVEMTYQVTKTCENGKEQTSKKRVYARNMFRFEEGRKLLEKKNYHNVMLLDAEWTDVLFVDEVQFVDK